MTEQWQYSNPDILQVFSPETMAMFEDIVEQCELKPVKTNNDNNPDIVISNQDIEMISEYLKETQKHKYPTKTYPAKIIPKC